MNPFDFPFALLGFFGLVAVMPAWMFFITSYAPMENLPTEAQFLAQLVLPATVALFVVSWLQGG
ncbi:hypothetical protein HWV23_02435 [Natronomonas halophila]|uniref:hypothetical protein n=1 Tax=Natronomonas halophila TaxID=2747817 RepID=UPI0015B5F896|nr:hypothetical protein [Natronomonas halophila]QLD84613.1 hypothetical protein HWV23_02435 [Natronomonas halophila]